jgi:hypothetical protein
MCIDVYKYVYILHTYTYTHTFIPGNIYSYSQPGYERGKGTLLVNCVQKN